jgi:hopanoid biosynthesis associated protein HpnK
MERRIVINADDFGICEGVNKGIVEAHCNGVLTSATIMANMPAAQQAVVLAKRLPKLSIGVHLNLTDGKPVCPVANIKYLVDGSGNFALKPGKLAIAATLSGKARAAIEAEFAAQIQWVLDRGVRPTHLDSHKHIHSFPAIFRIVCRLAKQFRIPAIRFAYEPKDVSNSPWPLTDAEGRKRAAIVRLMAKINQWQSREFFKTDALFGVAHTGKINVDFFRAVSLYNTVATAEVMTHPGYSYDLDVSQTRLVGQRETELEAICSEKTRQYFKEAGIKLVHYGELQ